MSGEMLLINPRRRRARKATRVIRRRRNPMTALAAPRRRRRNPIRTRVHHLSARRRRRNPIGSIRHHMRRRRRNPIGGVSGKNIMAMFKEAGIGAAGSVAVDVAMGYINPMLPASMVVVPGTVGVGDAVKAGITVALGHFLDKPTRGASRKMALGALTVQFAGILRSFVPASMTLGYNNASGQVVQGSARIAPIRRNMSGVGAFVPAQSTLSAFTNAPTALLSNHRARMSGYRGMAEREGVRR